MNQQIILNKTSSTLLNDQSDQTITKNIDPVSFFQLFRFADKLDYFLMITGTITAVGNGVALPAFMIIFGGMVNAFGYSEINPNAMIQQSKNQFFKLIEIGAAVLVASFLMTSCWIITGQRQGVKCREIYLKKLLQQQIGWFDQINQNELASKFASETFAFQSAIGQKIGVFIMACSGMIAGLVISLYEGWQLGLVIIAYLPVLIIMGTIYMRVSQNREKIINQYYTEAGGKAQQTIASIKTVKSLNGQEYQMDKFERILEKTTSKTINFVTWAGFGQGGMAFASMSVYCLAFWYGSKLMVEHNSGDYDTGKIMIVLFSLAIGGTYLGQISPSLKKFVEGEQAAANIYALLNRKSRLWISPNGKKLQNVVGIIKFENVTFAYPKDPKKIILQNFSFQIKPNQTNALVGESGCGKSTIMQLIMRFYDPIDGRITLDGIDLKEFDLAWLRSIIGYVGQEPVLFAASIKENMIYGKPQATDEQIINALKKAQAYQFISELQDRIETYVGFGGGQFSGGQKQRIAIARAILKNPKILLLDEATSALDRKNERLIQQTLDKFSAGRTTISIAHRIKTIMNAKQIFVLQDGKLIQHGTFNVLKKFKNIEIDQNLQPLNQIKHDSKQNLNQTQLNNKKQEAESLKEDLETKRRQLLLEKYKDSIFSRLFSYNRPDLLLFILGAIISSTTGVIYPVLSIYFAKMINALLLISNGFPQSEANNIVIALLLIAILSFLFIGFTASIFLVVGQKITKRLRIDTFRKIIKMPVSWFDIPRNNCGSLAARLSTDCRQIKQLVSTLISLNIQIISCLTSGLIIGFYYQWRISLVTLGILPLLIGTSMIRTQSRMGFSAKTDDAYKDSSNIIMQSMINIRTVVSFGVENMISQIYNKKLQIPVQLTYKTSSIQGILYGLAQFTRYLLFGLVFYIGTLFVKTYHVDSGNLFIAIISIIFSTRQAGSNGQALPDMGACKNSAINIFQILDGQDEEMIQVKQNSKMIKETQFSGLIQIKKITFKYPTRIKQIFKDFSIRIESGHKVALVGSSGCGKSTIIQLLLRFYQPDQGQILIDGINIKDYDRQYLRSIFGLVSQEPVLFFASFQQNIEYNIKDVEFKDIREAARKANALMFIEGQEEIALNKEKKIIQNSQLKGFNRSVGVKGSHISGGQKQRVAIARAIIRNPKILLLDEATSALDSKNEQIVQASLDYIMKGLATITIAHRIETIKNSDKIYVMENGKIIEQGKYNQLHELKGHFYQLQQGTSK